MSILIDGSNILSTLSEKYADQYEKDHPHMYSYEWVDGIHPFWYWCQDKFGFKINWHPGSGEIVFDDEKEYLSFVLKEL